MADLPNDAAERKALPIASGVLAYFPDALAEVARVSRIGNEQHHPGSPLHWDKSKSTDEADALVRHLLDRGTFDTDGTRHSAKVAWRALALLQRELDAEAAVKVTEASFLKVPIQKVPAPEDRLPLPRTSLEADLRSEENSRLPLTATEAVLESKRRKNVRRGITGAG